MEAGHGLGRAVGTSPGITGGVRPLGGCSGSACMALTKGQMVVVVVVVVVVVAVVVVVVEAAAVVMKVTMHPRARRSFGALRRLLSRTWLFLARSIAKRMEMGLC